ncbi:MAG: thiol oxidoreductase [Chitinophagaceae bacterium]|nr:MAG: thiol oxidoreductase [Chitinophagaceae bacterium]
MNSVVGVLVAACVLVVSCAKLFPKAPEDDAVLDGPVEGLTAEQKAIFIRGDVAFNDEIFTPEKGLGPLFVATSCGTCHAGDGKGHPFTSLIRFGQTNSLGNQFLNQGGPQLQNRAIPGFLPEQIPIGSTFSKFLPPATTGLGFLEEVSDATLLSLSDEFDANGDGISGRPNWISIPSYVNIRRDAIIQNGKYIGRFGRKAAVYDLRQQTANAYNQDMGISSNFETIDTYSGQVVDAEVANKTIHDVVGYLQTLKAPIQRNISNQEIISGKQIFIETGCGKCHTPQLTTGYSSIAALSRKQISPYSDLLLHDMGSGLDDGYTEGSALSSEWRTTPLWGLGLSKQSQGGQYFLLHDGRAKTIEKAILLHGGEGAQSKNAFQQLNAQQKSQLLKFLESL